MSDQPPFTGCINWQAYDTHAIWQILKDEDAAKGYEGVTSWNTVSSHLDVQEERLRYARHALAAVWPPEQNESARAFLQEIDRTLTSMAETRNTACDILSGLNGIVSELADARKEVRAQLAHRMDAADDLKPRFFDHAEDKIDAQVRQAMAQREKAFADHASKIQPPPMFKLELSIFGDPTPPGPTGTPETGVGSRNPDGGYTPVPVQVPHDPPAPRPGHDPFAPQKGMSGGDGPVLGGAKTLPTQGGGGGHLSPVQSGTSDSFLPGLIAGGMATSALGGLMDRPGTMTSPGAVRPVAVRSGLPSGTVIGGAAADGSIPGAKSVPGRSVSPSVIGGGQPGAAGRSTAMMQGMQNGAHGRRGQQGDTVDLEPTSPWEADEGVAPVIKPDERVIRHDAGVEVIGWDR